VVVVVVVVVVVAAAGDVDSVFMAGEVFKISNTQQEDGSSLSWRRQRRWWL
jgi:hypothetical protein